MSLRYILENLRESLESTRVQKSFKRVKNLVTRLASLQNHPKPWIANHPIKDDQKATTN